MALALYRPNESLAERSTFELMPQALELAKQLAATEFVPVALRNRPAAVMACILAGHEVGLPPMASLQHVHVIEGRPTLSAASQRALVLAHGHEIWIEEQTATRATVCGRRKGEERILQVTWTLDDAKRAGLSGKQNWQRYPRNMLVARSTGDVCRGAFMDVLGGIAYNTEEAEDFIEGQVVGEGKQEESPAPAKPATKRRATRAATAPSGSSEPPPGPEPEPTGEIVEAQFREAEEPPPAPEPGATPEPGQPDPDSQPKAGQKAEGEHLSLAQQVAMHCREAGIERQDLLFAVTGKLKGSEITRPQAIEVLEAAKAIARGEKRLVDLGQGWQVLDVSAEEISGEHIEMDQALAEQEGEQW